ncbi:MAG TPA: hypothetical protein VFV38_52875, partial [Ktedonobacteraceae bacterium]|nr:hypothetical protein [Ktedonobacteraceae bacterium]
MNGSFGRACMTITSPTALLALEQQTDRSERFLTLDALVGTLLVRSLHGEHLVTCSGNQRAGWHVRIEGLSAIERQYLEKEYRVEQQQARGAWFLPTAATLEIGMVNFPLHFQQNAQFADEMTREDQRKVSLSQSPDAVFHWAVLNPLFNTLFLPMKLHGRLPRKPPREHLMSLWAEIDRLHAALGFTVAAELAVMRYGGGWSRLRAHEQLEAHQRYLAALIQQARPQMGSRYRAFWVLQLVVAYYHKAKDGLATRKQVLTKALEPVLVAFFGGDWLAFLDYLGEQPHPDEEVVTVLPETRLYLGGQQRAAEVAAQLGVSVSEVGKMAAAFWNQADEKSPVEQRVAVLDRYWQVFDTIHTQQRPGMRPLWGLVEDFPIPHLLPAPSSTPYQTQLYRHLLPPALLTDIHQLWGTMILPAWPDRQITTPLPHALLAEALGPALTFWHGCALTAWFLCEGPY